MSYPVLYDAYETEFSHGGFGFLSDCIQCAVTEEANGEFELFIRYPVDGIHFENIENRCIVKAKLEPDRDAQLFRIYSISKPMSKVVSIYAHHISYDLSGIPVSPYIASNLNDAMHGLTQNAVTDCPFTFWTDKESTSPFSVAIPSSIRSQLMGEQNSILSVYGGEYEFDNYTVKLYNSRGEDRGVSVRYGKNLLDINQEESVSSLHTGIYPYWIDQTTGSVFQLPEKIVNAPGTYSFSRILTLDVSSEFETKPTEEQLRTFSTRYIEKNKIGIPAVSLSVSFAQIDQSEEYRSLKLFERVSLFDVISVDFPILKVSAKAKIVKIVYDILLDRIKSVSVGSVKQNIADTIANMQSSQKKNL